MPALEVVDSMSFLDQLFDAKCSSDEYEEPSEDVYVECATRFQYLAPSIIAGISIVIVLLFAAYGGIGGIKAGFMIIGIFAVCASSMLLGPRNARYRHQAAQRDLSMRMSAGMSRADALRDVETQRNAAQLNAAMAQRR